MKKLITILLALAIVGGAEAQTKLSAGTRLQMHLRKNAPKQQSHRAGNQQDEMIGCFIRFNTPCIQELEALGVKTQVVLGNIVTADVPLSVLGKVAELKQVESVEVERQVYTQSDKARENTKVDKILHDGKNNGLPQNFNGEGVIIGVLDTGVDFRHPALRNADGSSRCSLVYMPSRTWSEGQGGTHVTKEKFGYELPGVVYTEKNDIDSLTCDVPNDSHGTHTVSTAAGREVGIYGGVAPGADLIVAAVGGDMSDKTLINSMVVLLSYAKEHNKPLVISKSIGAVVGPHDGTSPSVQQEAAICKEGAILCQSAGNAGMYNCYIHLTPDSLQTINIDGVDRKYWAMITCPWDNLAEENDNCKVLSEIWGTDDTPFDMAVVSYSIDGGLQMEVNDPEKGTYFVKYEDYLEDGEFGFVHRNVSNDSILAFGGVSPNNNKFNNTFMWYYTTNKNKDYYKTAKYLGLMIFPRKDNQELHMWINTFQGCPLRRDYVYKNPSNIRLMTGDSSISCNDECSQNSNITVGNYISKLNYVTLDNKQYTEEKNREINDIAPSSSYGTTINGIVAPTICGPGTTIAAAVNHNDPEYNSDGKSVMKEEASDGTIFRWAQMSGTSMSTPHVAGIMALWLQANPKLTRDQLVDVMKQTSIASTKEKARWGAIGRIDALEGLKYILKTSDIRDLEVEKALDAQGNIYNLNGQMVRSGNSTANLPAGIYIHNGRKVVIK